MDRTIAQDGKNPERSQIQVRPAAPAPLRPATSEKNESSKQQSGNTPTSERK